MKKLEAQVQKLTERAVNAETTLENTDKLLKEATREREGLKKETEVSADVSGPTARDVKDRCARHTSEATP